MTKYARAVPVDGARQMLDVLDTAAYEPRPTWGQTDEALLARLFAPQLVEEWKAQGVWFVETLQGVQNGAVFTGNDYADPTAYVNPDNTDGNGAPIGP